MKLPSGTAAVSLPQDNLDGAIALMNSQEQGNLAAAWYLALADLLDSFVKSQVTHVTIGLNSKRTSFLVTVNPSQGEKVYIVGKSVEEVVYNWVTGIADSAASAPLRDDHTATPA